jgi:2-polyprenyl-6-hydroxyphenyl methylase/3-demethylubiquinone-9 3-methyltransferase
MPLGPAVRRALGRFEPAAARAYRGAFCDLDAMAATLASLVPEARRILEVGCGDGAASAALLRALPEASLVGIDPANPAPGRLFDGDTARVHFRRTSAAGLLADAPAPFDLVLVCDVLHHVPQPESRVDLLRDAAAMAAPGATVAVKEWEPVGRVAPAFYYVLDRWVAGDPDMHFLSRPELDGVVRAALPGWRLTCEARIPPRRANLLLTLRRGPAASAT